MKISTKGRYALRLMIELANNDNGSFMTLKEISAKQDISKKYLEQIVPMLNNAHMLIANRGFQGGYKLAKSPAEYTVGQILRITEGSMAPVACLDHDPIQCERCETCDTLPIWKGLYKTINDYLDGITLQDIIDEKRSNAGNEYII